jgi:hypothetical protein
MGGKEMYAKRKGRRRGSSSIQDCVPSTTTTGTVFIPSLTLVMRPTPTSRSDRSPPPPTPDRHAAIDSSDPSTLAPQHQSPTHQHRMKVGPVGGHYPYQRRPTLQRPSHQSSPLLGLLPGLTGSSSLTSRITSTVSQCQSRSRVRKGVDGMNLPAPGALASHVRRQRGVELLLLLLLLLHLRLSGSNGTPGSQ